MPCTPSEALTSSLVGIWQKNKFRGFLQFCGKYQDSDPATHEGLKVDKMTAAQLFEFYDLNEDTIDFTGHALALYMDDAYMKKPVRCYVAEKSVLFFCGRVRIGSCVARFASLTYLK